MRAYFLGLALLFPTVAGATDVYGNLTGSNTWTLANSPYVMTGDVVVKAGATLTIETGVTVNVATTDMMAAGADTTRCELIVDGSLTAQGSSGSPITFTSQGTGKGIWRGIRVETGGSATLQYLVINESQRALETAVDTTAANFTVTGNNYGFYPTAGTLTVNNSTLDGNDYGIYTAGGSVNASFDAVTNNSSYGVYLSGAGTGTLHHLTLSANGSFGLYASLSTGANYVVRDSIIASNSSYGVYRSGSSGSFGYSYNDAWGNPSGDTTGVSFGAGTFSSNPLFVGSGNYRITSNSPARGTASDASDLGALAYQSDQTQHLVGTLHANTTLSGANTIYGDLVVAPGVTLTLSPGATLNFATTDEAGGGVDTARPELIVQGTLNANGSAASPITLTSQGTSKGSWYGVRFVSGSSGNTIANVTVNEAIRAVDVAADVTVSALTATLCNYGVYVNGATATVNGSNLSGNDYGIYTSSGALNASHTIAAANSSYGVYVSGAGTGTLDHLTLSANGSFGFYASLSTGANYTLRDSIVASNSSYGVYRSGSSGTFSYSFNDAWGNPSGDTTGVSLGSGTFAANPLFAGTGNYKITTNSPARLAASDGSDLGALAYAGDATVHLVGTLYVNTTLSGSNIVYGDLTVAPGVTLTLSPGATLTFATSDEMAGGVDTARPELIVKGTVNAPGTTGSPVTLTSQGTSKASWYGVRFVAGSSGNTFTNVNVNEAVRAVDVAADVTLSGLVAGTNNYGVYVNGATATVNNSTLSGNDYGIYTSSGALNASHTVAANNSSYGVYVSGAGTGTLDHLTLSGNGSFGFYASLSTGANYTLRDSIIASNSSYGVYRSGSSGTFSYSFNDAWGNPSGDTTGVSFGSGTFAANPLFVGGGNFRITSNSPARNAASDGSDLGALAYGSDATAHLVGTLYVNTTLSGTNTLYGDLTVAPGVTLTLSPGAILNFPTNDEMAGGVDTARAELIVKGTLNASGTAGSPINLTSTGTSKASWYGVRFLTGSSGNSFSNVNVNKAVRAVDSQVDVTLTSLNAGTNNYGVYPNGGNVTLTSSTLSANDYGIYVGSGSVSGSYNLVSGNSSYGVYLSGAGTGVLHHFTVTGNGSFGVYASLSTGANYTLRDSIIASNSSYGVYRSGSSGTFSYSYNDAWGNPSGDTTGVSAGAGTFSSNPLFVGASDFHLQATSPARGAASDATDLGAFPFSVGAVATVVVTPASTSVAAGGMRTFTATAYDAANQPVPGVTFTWSATAAAGTINASSGVLTAACTPGVATAGVTATASGKSGSADVTITQGAVATVAISPTTANLGAGGQTTFTATAKDACNNAVAGATFSFSTTPGAGSITGAGVYTAPCSPGSYPSGVTVTSGGLSASASVTVSVGALAALSISPQNPTLPAAGQQQFSAAGSDSCGNAVTPSVTWSTAGGAGTINSSSGLFTAGATPGSYGSAVTTTQGGVSASTGVTITGGSVATVEVTPAMISLTAGAQQQFAAVAKDAQGNVVSGAVTWALVSGGGTISSTGMLTASNTAGSFGATVQATVAGVAGTASLTVVPGPAAMVAVTPMSATLAPSGTTTFSAQVSDSFGNLRNDAVTWSVNPAAAGSITMGGVFTAGTAPGNYPGAITATTGALSGTASVSVQTGALSRLELTPVSTSVRAAGTVGFSVTGRDGNGNVVPVTPTWAVVHGGGTIDMNGIFTAGQTPGTFIDTVQAQANGLAATATVVVTPGPVVAIDVTPSHPELDPQATQQFSADAHDAFGNPVTGVNFHWSAMPEAGSISVTGLFTAGVIAGDFPSSVTVDDGSGITGSASVKIRGQVTDGGMQPDAGSMMDGGTHPDGGPGDMHFNAKSGCSCNEGTGLLPLAAIALLGLLKRRKEAR